MNLSQRFAIASAVVPICFLSSVPEVPAFLPLTGARERQAFHLGIPQSESALYSLLGKPHYSNVHSSWWVLQDGDYLRADRTCLWCASFSQIHREPGQL